jgi:hypothetical protein
VPPPERLDFEAVLRVLARHGVEYIVVGGVCGALHGAPVTTFDLDVVHSRSEANVARLLTALEELNASYRFGQGDEDKPNASHLSSPGHRLLLTRFGPLDLLGVIGKGHGYAELAPHAVILAIEAGHEVRMLDLETLIRTKEEVAGEKDLAALSILRRVRDEQRCKEPQSGKP